jgi:hypothetical protein
MRTAPLRYLARLLFLSSLLISLSSVPARADEKTNKAVLAQLITLYSQAMRTYEKRDVQQFLRLTTPDFIAKRPDGQSMSRAEYEKFGQAALAKMRTIIETSSKVDRVSVQGSLATAVSSITITFTPVPDKTGIAKTFTVESVSRDTWQKTPAGWRMKLTEGLSGKVKEYHPKGKTGKGK